MAKDIAMGMSWLHELNICHLDLKPKNILIDKHGVLKVADFGYSRLIQNTRHLLLNPNNNVLGGSPIYMAPERLQTPKNFNKSSDVYSFAIIFWEILTGEIPYEGHSDLTEFKNAVLRDKQRPSLHKITKMTDSCSEQSSSVNSELSGLLKQMWDHDTDVRPTFRQIIIRLDDLLIESAIGNPIAKMFWIDNFNPKTKNNPVNGSPLLASTQGELQTSVPWEQFVKAIGIAFKPPLKRLFQSDPNCDTVIQNIISSINELPPQGKLENIMAKSHGSALLSQDIIKKQPHNLLKNMPL